MHALNALTFFINPFIIRNYSGKRAFEKRWNVSFRKTKATLFRDFYYKIKGSARFTSEEIDFLEDFSHTLLASSKSTANKIMDSWDEICDSYSMAFNTTRGKIIKLYWILLDDLKRHNRVTKYEPVTASEIIDAFAWLFGIEAENFKYKN